MNEHSPPAAPLEAIVGQAVKRDRQISGMTLTQLSESSGVSTAMISKIERGQVSPSLSTLDALAGAMGVPVVNFLADTAEVTDISHVRAGEGMAVRREGDTYAHVYRLIGQANADDVRLRLYLIELDDPTRGEPLLSHPGVESIHVISGVLAYRCGKTVFELHPGDTLTFKTRTPHGPVALPKAPVMILTVIAEPAGGPSVPNLKFA